MKLTQEEKDALIQEAEQQKEQEHKKTKILEGFSKELQELQKKWGVQMVIQTPILDQIIQAIPKTKQDISIGFKLK